MPTYFKISNWQMLLSLLAVRSNWEPRLGLLQKSLTPSVASSGKPTNVGSQEDRKKKRVTPWIHVFPNEETGCFQFDSPTTGPNKCVNARVQCSLPEEC